LGLKENKKIAIIFERRNASDKGSTIKCFKEYFNPRAVCIVTLNQATKVKKTYGISIDILRNFAMLVRSFSLIEVEITEQL
jgi:hypothetical protein